MKAFFVAAALALAACSQSSDVMRELERAEKADAQAAQTQAAESARYMDAQRARTGVQSTPSGLAYEFVTRSTAQNLAPTPDGATVLVHYEGKLADGTVFDSSFERGQRAEFPLNGVIAGFAEALRLMRPGDEVIAYIPPDIGYGPQGSPPAIPPNAALRFRIQLAAYAEPDGTIATSPDLERRR
jgi:FKBP-type peptidyl-prolyl cis-trans isomerase